MKNMSSVIILKISRLLALLQPSLFLLIQADHGTLTVSTLSKTAGKFLFGQKVPSISPEPISHIKSVLSDAVVMKIWLGR